MAEMTPYERHVRECQAAGIPLANAPWVPCECDGFEGAQGAPGQCECGHAIDDHEDGGNACMEQEGVS